MSVPGGLVFGCALTARRLSSQPSGRRLNLLALDSSRTHLLCRPVSTESSPGTNSTAVPPSNQSTAQGRQGSSTGTQDGAGDPPRVRVHVEDIFPNSLQETLEAHKRRTEQNEELLRHRVRQPLIRYLSSKEKAGNDALKKPGQMQSEASPIWSSFKDFCAQHQVSDADLLVKLGHLGGSATNPAWNEDKGASPQLAENGESKGAQPGDIGRNPAMVPSTSEPPTRLLRDHTVGTPQDVQAPWNRSSSLPSSVLQVQEKMLHATDDQLLTASIVAFDDFMTLDLFGKEALKHLVDPTVKLMEKTLPRTRIVLHGSHATGLASILSDVDLNLPKAEAAADLSADSPDAKRSAKLDWPLKKLRAAFKKIGQDNGESSLTHFLAMRYPMLRYRRAGFEIQISSGRETSATTQTVLSLLDEYPTIRPIYQVLRHTLSIRELSNPVKGGVGSYTLLVMIVTALKHSKQVTFHDSLGQQLLAVLEFWSEADVNTLGFAATPPITFPKFGTGRESANEASATGPLVASLYHKSRLTSPEGRRAYIADTILATETLHDPVQAGIVFLQDRNRFFQRSARGHRHHARGPWQLSLQDPADPTNDLGVAAYRIHDVLATLRVLHEEVIGKLSVWHESPPGVDVRESPRSNPIWPLVAAETSGLLRRRRMFRNMVAESASQEPMGEKGTEAPPEPPRLSVSFYEASTPTVRKVWRQSRDLAYSIVGGNQTDVSPGREPPTSTVLWRSTIYNGIKSKERKFRRVEVD